MTVGRMAEDGTGDRSALWRMARIVALGTAVMFLGGMMAGMAAGHFGRGGGMPSARFIAIAIAALALLIGCGWVLLRDLRWGSAEGPPTRKERLNRNILIASGVIGAAMGAVMVLSGGATTDAMFSSAPLPPAVAAVFVAVFLLILPPLTLYWQKRAIDEQEIDAYKTGALIAIQVYMLGAPAWWFAWRGGFVPEPSGIAIYLVTVFTMGIVWIGKKYG